MTSVPNSLHLAVDVLDVYVDRLCPERRDLAARIDDFARAVSPWAATGWISNCVLPDDLVLVRDMDKRAVAARLYTHRLLCSPTGPQDFFVNKNQYDAFTNKRFTAHVATMAPSVLFVSGLNTSACVAATIAGALRQGQCVVAVADLLGDLNSEAERPLSPQDHASCLTVCVNVELFRLEVQAEQSRRDRHPRDYAGALHVSFADVLPTVKAHMQRLEILSAAEVLASMPVRAERRRRAGFLPELRAM